MPRTKQLAAALVLAATVGTLAACGSSTDKTISPEDANTLLAELAGAQEAALSGDCATASSKAQAFVTTVNNLPESTGADVKTALRSAGQQLDQLAQDPSQCRVSGASGASGAQPAPAPTTNTTPTTTTSTTSSDTTTTTTHTAPPPSAGGGGNQGGNGQAAGSGGGSGGGSGSGGTGGTPGNGGTGG